jgi:hypothetical protein
VFSANHGPDFDSVLNLKINWGPPVSLSFLTSISTRRWPACCCSLTLSPASATDRRCRTRV